MARSSINKTQYVRLKERLVLLAWLNSLFGYEHNRDLLEDMKGARIWGGRESL